MHEAGDLSKHREGGARIWKQREKQIDKMLLNTTHMHGSIRGIVGDAIPAVWLLELPGVPEDAEEEVDDEA